MASYLRPRRGKEATAKSQNIVLKRGEIFFETPASGVGTGIGRLKMGDGSTSYASLPYFLRQLDLSDNNTKCAFTNATAATASSNNATYLNNIAPTNSLKTVFQNIKQLLLNYNSQLTSLNNDLTWVEIYSTSTNFTHIIPKEYNEIWISVRIQYIPTESRLYIARDFQIGIGGKGDYNRIYTDNYYFDENNRVTWGVQYDIESRTISMPDNWINAYYNGTKFTPNKILSIWCRKFK